VNVRKLAAPIAVVFLLASCGKKAEPVKGSIATETAHSPATNPAPAPPAEAIAGKEPPPDPLHAGAAAKDPHAGMERQAINAGTGRKGRVVETMNAAGYTYLRVDEKGASVWLAVMEVPVKVGDVVEFPDSPPMTGFKSKTLNRTFDSILFVPGIRIEKSK
jgi:hypothetical protein